MIEALTIFLSKNILTILWISALSTLGASVGYINRISELIGEVVISFFLAIVTYFLCKGSGVNEILIVGVVGVVSHLGTKGLSMLEQVIPKAICKYLNINCEDSK
jgi:hypothetical protein